MSVELAVQIFERDGTPPLTTPNATLRARRYSWRAEGGPWQAQVEAEGDAEALGWLMERLGCPIEIGDAEARRVWWGRVVEIRLQHGIVETGVSLRGMVNRIAVAYVDSSTGQRATTAWVQDDDSVALYGKQERLLTLTNATASEAEAYRDRALADLRFPRPTLSLQQGRSVAPRVTMLCAGRWAMLNELYYADAAGYVRNEVEATQHVKVGQDSYINTAIGFEDISDGDRIYDLGSGFGGFLAGDRVIVSGASEPDNNGTKDVTGASGTHLLIATDLDPENPGNSITIAQASGTQSAQSFTISDAGGWRLAEVRLMARAAGSPADNLRVQVCADSGGAPGSVLATASVAAADLAADKLEWVTFAFDSSVSLSASTTYWLVVSRSGSLASASGYAVGIDPSAGYAGGALYVYSGSWAARSPAADLAFVVAGTRDTTDQVEAILTASGQFAGVEIEDTSGIYASPYRDGDATAQTEVEALLRTGTTGGRRLLATMTQEQWIRIYEAPSSTDPHGLHANGQFEDHLGRVVEHHLCPVGIWLQVLDLPSTLDVARETDPTLLFVEEMEYNVDSGLLRPLSYGSRNPWSSRATDG